MHGQQLWFSCPLTLRNGQCGGLLLVNSGLTNPAQTVCVETSQGSPRTGGSQPYGILHGHVIVALRELHDTYDPTQGFLCGGVVGLFNAGGGLGASHGAARNGPVAQRQRADAVVPVPALARVPCARSAAAGPSFHRIRLEHVPPADGVDRIRSGGHRTPYGAPGPTGPRLATGGADAAGRPVPAGVRRGPSDRVRRRTAWQDGGVGQSAIPGGHAWDGLAGH